MFFKRDLTELVTDKDTSGFKTLSPIIIAGFLASFKILDSEIFPLIKSSKIEILFPITL